MSFFNLQAFFDQFNQVSPLFYIAALFLSGSLLVLIQDWRVIISALLFQYLILGVLLAQFLRPEIAFAKVLVGLFVCPMLFISARQANWRRGLSTSHYDTQALFRERRGLEIIFSSGRSFRLMALLLIALTTFSLARTYPITVLPFNISLAVYWLLLSGMLILIITEAPLQVGLGLLTLLIGFELWYTALEDSLLMIALLGVSNILIALAIGYLTAVRGVVLEEDI